MPAESTKALKIFYCYARKDKELRDELEKHLEPLRRSGQIITWCDRDIQPGMKWKSTIDANLNDSDIILLLISPNFMRSDYCYSVEMHQALEKQKTGELIVIPIILRPVDCEETPISELQALPTDGRAVSKWRSRDEALENVARGIRKVVETLQSRKTAKEYSHTPLPWGLYRARPIYFFWIVDCSGSMELDGKMRMVNTAIKELIFELRHFASDNPYISLLVSIIKFSNGAQWHTAQPTTIEDFVWTDLTTGGGSDMGEALLKVAEQIAVSVPAKALPPVLILISDGLPTDDFEHGLKMLMAQPWGRKAVRLAIAVGKGADRDVLQKFIGNPELQPLQANSPKELVNYIRWASSAAIGMSSTHAPILTPPSSNQFLEDVW